LLCSSNSCSAELVYADGAKGIGVCSLVRMM